MSNDIDLAADFADSGADTPVLPPLEELYGQDALPEDLDLDAMLSVATDPNTPAPEGDLIPNDDYAPSADDMFADEPYDSLDDDFLPTSAEPEGFDHQDDDPFAPAGNEETGSSLDDIDPGV